MPLASSGLSIGLRSQETPPCDRRGFRILSGQFAKGGEGSPMIRGQLAWCTLRELLPVSDGFVLLEHACANQVVKPLHLRPGIGIRN